MAINVEQTPNSESAAGSFEPFDLAYGPNPITLSNIDSGFTKYVVRILVVGNPDPIAELRQTPNRQGKAIFDIQNILQSYVGPLSNDIDSLHFDLGGFVAQNTRMALAGPTLLEYQIQYSQENDGVIDPAGFTTISNIFTCIAGSKQYFEVPFNTDPYRPEIEGDDSNPVCSVIERAAGPLSDNMWTIPDTATGDTLLTANGGYPSVGGIDMHNVYMDDQCTKSFYQKVQLGSPIPAPNVNGIEAFYVLQFNYAGAIISNNILANTQSSGGGPNLSIGQGTGISGPFQVITVATGPANFPVGVLSTACTHYYIVPVVYGQVACSPDSQQQTPLMSAAAWRAQRYNIAHKKIYSGQGVVIGIEQLSAECNDYSHIQFAWQNSLGYRDQFTFTKRVNHNTNTRNNNFLKGAADYNGTNYSVDLQDRGYTTYSQKIENDFTVMSNYMNDEEAQLLKHLHQSAEVKVRFASGPYANQWVPVVITKTSYNQKTIRKDKLFQYTVNFRLASNTKSMRG
jgi:hypothetical protein